MAGIQTSSCQLLAHLKTFSINLKVYPIKSKLILSYFQILTSLITSTCDCWQENVVHVTDVQIDTTRRRLRWQQMEQNTNNMLIQCNNNFLSLSPTIQTLAKLITCKSKQIYLLKINFQILQQNKPKIYSSCNISD